MRLACCAARQPAVGETGNSAEHGAAYPPLDVYHRLAQPLHSKATIRRGAARPDHTALAGSSRCPPATRRTCTSLCQLLPVPPNSTSLAIEDQGYGHHQGGGATLRTLTQPPDPDPHLWGRISLIRSMSITALKLFPLFSVGTAAATSASAVAVARSARRAGLRALSAARRSPGAADGRSCCCRPATPEGAKVVVGMAAKRSPKDRIRISGRDRCWNKRFGTINRRGKAPACAQLDGSVTRHAT